MYNYIEKEIEDMIENNAHRYRSNKNNNNDDKEPPIEDLLSTESMGFLSRLKVCKENLIKDIYCESDQNVELHFDPNDSHIRRQLSDMINRMDEGIHKKLIKLLYNGYNIEDICGKLEISEVGYHPIYNEALVKLRIIFRTIVRPEVLPYEELRSNDSKNIDYPDYPLSLDFSNVENIGDIIVGMFDDIH